jgi:hypothetical protein
MLELEAVGGVKCKCKFLTTGHFVSAIPGLQASIITNTIRRADIILLLLLGVYYSYSITVLLNDVNIRYN